MKNLGFMILGAAVGMTVGATVTTCVMNDPKAYRTARHCKHRAMRSMDGLMGGFMNGHGHK